MAGERRPVRDPGFGPIDDTEHGDAPVVPFSVDGSPTTSSVGSAPNRVLMTSYNGNNGGGDRSDITTIKRSGR